jgi:hypothetical protein
MNSRKIGLAKTGIMRNIIWLLALIFLLLIQAGILLPLHMFPVGLILIVVAMATILSDFNQGLVITILGGLLLDFVSGSPDGLLSMSLVAAFLVMHLVLSEILSREPNRFILATSVVGTVVIYFVSFIIFSKIFGVFGLTENQDLRYLFAVQLPLTLMWNLIFSYPIFLFYTLIQNLVSKVKPDDEVIKV